jgi:hypothetical protein
MALSDQIDLIGANLLPYIVYNDLPKLEHLKKELPSLLKRK